MILPLSLEKAISELKTILPKEQTNVNIIIAISYGNVDIFLRMNCILRECSEKEALFWVVLQERNRSAKVERKAKEDQI
jgi:hypothetical protein